MERRTAAEAWWRAALVFVSLITLAAGCRSMPVPHAAEEAEPAVSAKPVVAVLPFTNTSGNPDQAQFVDGITKQIFTALSMSPVLTVISQESTSFYKGAQLDIQQVGKELGAGYVVAGSARKAGDSMWFSASLIDLRTGKQIWSETDERDVKDVASVQQEISLQISIACLNAALAENPNHMQLYAPLANAYLALSSIQQDEQTWLLDSAFKTAAKCLDLSFDESDLSCVGAMLTVAQGLTYHKTITYLEEALAGHPDKLWLYLLLSDLYANIPTHDAEEKKRAYAEKALERDPDSAYAHWRIAFNYLQRYSGEIEWGAEKKGLEMAEKCVAVRENMYWCHRALAVACLANDLPDQAIAEAQRALAIDPTLPIGYALLANAYLAADRYGDIPDSVIAYWGLGETYRDMGRYGDAIAAYQYVSTLEPDLPGTYVSLANSYISLWTFLGTHDPQVLDRAIEMAQKALTLDEDHIQARAVLARIHLSRKEYEEAAVEAQKAISIDPYDRYGLACMARVLNASGNPEKAVKAVDRMRQVDPNTGFCELAEAYHRMGEFEKAVGMYRQALALHTDYETSFEGHLSLAILYSELERSEEAKAEAVEVLKLVPDFSVNAWSERAVYQDPASIKRNAALLYRAGLK